MGNQNSVHNNNKSTTHCLHDGCDYERYIDNGMIFSYCPMHKCKTENCIKPKSNKFFSVYCDSHFYKTKNRCEFTPNTVPKYCSFVGCEEKSCSDSGYCKFHQNILCSNEDCSNSSGSLDTRLCKQHTCQCCSRIICPNSVYCEQHKCQYKGCNKKKKEHTGIPVEELLDCSFPAFCDDHSCSVHVRKKYVIYDDAYGWTLCNQKAEPSYVCEEHQTTAYRCKFNGCNLLRKFSRSENYKDYCDSHCCNYYKCNNYATVESKYCKKHECDITECHAIKSKLNYCKEHECLTHNCCNRAVSQQQLCNFCDK